MIIWTGAISSISSGGAGSISSGGLRGCSNCLRGVYGRGYSSYLLYLLGKRPPCHKKKKKKKFRPTRERR